MMKHTTEQTKENKMNRKNTISKVLVGALIIAAAAGASAQTIKTDKADEKSFGDKWSLQFQIGDNFSLSSFEGSVISVKRQLTERSALRFGLSLSRSNSDREESNSTYNERVTGSDVATAESGTTYDDDSRGTSIWMNVNYILQLNGNQKTRAYLGIGPRLGYRSTSFDSDRTPDGQTANAFRDGETKSKYYGAGLIFGVEWFASKSISFMAEYSITAMQRDTESVSTSTTVRDTGVSVYTATRTVTRNSSDFQINASRVKFGISVYF